MKMHFKYGSTADLEFRESDRPPFRSFEHSETFFRPEVVEDVERAIHQQIRISPALTLMMSANRPKTSEEFIQRLWKFRRR